MKPTTPLPEEAKKEFPYTDSFITSERWIKDSLRKGLTKKSRDFYIISGVSRLSDGRYLIELEKEFKII